MMHRHRPKADAEKIKELIAEREQEIADLKDIGEEDRTPDQNVRLTDLNNQLKSFKKRLDAAQKKQQ